MQKVTTRDIQPFIEGARQGDSLDPQKFVSFCEGFESIILWGAGNLGKALGEKMKELNIGIFAYWDANHASIEHCNDIDVYAPFSIGDAESSLILFCIGNVAVGPNIFRQLTEKGWQNVIHGNDLLQGLLCPLDNSKPANTAVCNSFDICSVCSCERLHNIVNANEARKHNISPQETLTFDRIHFITNNICNLKCTHCFIYVNSYPKERKQNVAISQILQDIEMTLSAIHSLGVVNIFGGEPFLHKKLDQIVSKVLDHENFGSVIVNSNGLVKIKSQQLEPMRDERVRLAFSNYLEVIEKEEEKVFFKNIEFAKSSGVNIKYQNSLPTWNVSSTLEHKGDDIEQMVSKKNACGVKFLYVFDGKVFPCAFTMSIYDLGVEDYSTDYVELAPFKSPEILRNEIKELVEKSHYGACGHCETFGSPALTNVAGEQGFDKRYRLPEFRTKKTVIPIVAA